jgi:predicted aspartyl protease
MAQQLIRSEDYPSLPISFEIRGIQGQASARLDTAFAGSVAIPSFLWNADELGNADTQASYLLADGRVTISPIYLGILEIEQFPHFPDIDFAIMEGPYHILGRGILNLFEITFDHGIQVILKP